MLEDPESFARSLCRFWIDVMPPELSGFYNAGFLDLKGLLSLVHHGPATSTRVALATLTETRQCRISKQLTNEFAVNQYKVW